MSNVSFGVNRQLRYFIVTHLVNHTGGDYKTINKEVIRFFNPWHTAITRTKPEGHVYVAETDALWMAYPELYLARLGDLARQLSAILPCSITVGELTGIFYLACQRYNHFISGTEEPPKPGIVPKVYGYRLPLGDTVLVMACYDITDCARTIGVNVDTFKTRIKRLDKEPIKKLHPRLIEAMDLALKHMYGLYKVTSSRVKLIDRAINVSGIVIQ